MGESRWLLGGWQGTAGHNQHSRSQPQSCSFARCQVPQPLARKVAESHAGALQPRDHSWPHEAIKRHPVLKDLPSTQETLGVFCMMPGSSLKQLWHCLPPPPHPLQPVPGVLAWPLQQLVVSTSPAPSITGRCCAAASLQTQHRGTSPASPSAPSPTTQRCCSCPRATLSMQHPCSAPQPAPSSLAGPRSPPSALRCCFCPPPTPSHRLLCLSWSPWSWHALQTWQSVPPQCPGWGAAGATGDPGHTPAQCLSPEAHVASSAPNTQL